MMGTAMKLHIDYNYLLRYDVRHEIRQGLNDFTQALNDIIQALNDFTQALPPQRSSD